MEYTAEEANYIAGTPYLGASVAMYPGPGDYQGELIAWDPLESGTVYLMQWLRSALASQLVATGRAPTRSALVKALREGETVPVDGYGVTPELYRELTALQWRSLVQGLACPVLALEGSCEPPFWRQTQRMHMRAPTMTQRSVQWLREHAA